MRLDTKMSLRTSLCLPNPSAMEGARWARLDTKMSLRTSLCLPNPSALRLKEVPAGQGARWVNLLPLPATGEGWGEGDANYPRTNRRF